MYCILVIFIHHDLLPQPPPRYSCFCSSYFQLHVLFYFIFLLFVSHWVHWVCPYAHERRQSNRNHSPKENQPDSPLPRCVSCQSSRISFSGKICRSNLVCALPRNVTWEFTYANWEMYLRSRSKIRMWERFAWSKKTEVWSKCFSQEISQKERLSPENTRRGRP